MQAYCLSCEKLKANKKLVGTRLILNFSYTNHYKTC